MANKILKFILVILLFFFIYFIFLFLFIFINIIIYKDRFGMAGIGPITGIGGLLSVWLSYKVTKTIWKRFKITKS